MNISEILQKKKEEMSNKNLEEGKLFLEENKKRDGVIVLESGLQYEIIEQGIGEKPTINDSVNCHYHGTLINGTVFDSSVERRQSARFPLKNVISGWTEALQLMPIGSKWRLFIPPNLAYGDRYISKEIGPNTTLIFEVELLGY